MQVGPKPFVDRYYQNYTPKSTKNMKKILTTMKAEFETLDTSDKALRKFGLLIGGSILLVVGIFALFIHKQLHHTMPVIGLIFVGTGALLPRLLLLPYYLWMGIAIVFGYFLGNILLFVLFYIFVTPIALLRFLFKKDQTKNPSSYWITREKSWTKESMEQLF